MAVFKALVYNFKISLKYNKKAFDIVRTRMKIRRANRWNNKFMEEMLSFDSCYISISLEDNIHFCCITNVNNSVPTYFGHDNIIGKNIKNIMPNILGNYHDKFVRRYINTG